MSPRHDGAGVIPVGGEEREGGSDVRPGTGPGIPGNGRRRRRGSEIVVPTEEPPGSTPPYVRCDSTEPFVMPPFPDDDAAAAASADPPDPSADEDDDARVAYSTSVDPEDPPSRRRIPNAERTTATATAKEVNSTLNLNLGLPIDPNDSRIRKLCKILSDFFSLFEEWIFRGWDAVPLRIRQKITMAAWAVYFPVHRYLLGNRTGIHPSSSKEYHALTTVLWWGRLFPVTIRRMRFSLGQLRVWHPTPSPSLPPSSSLLPRGRFVSEAAASAVRSRRRRGDARGAIAVKDGGATTTTTVEEVNFDASSDGGGGGVLVQEVKRAIPRWTERPTVHGFRVRHGTGPEPSSSGKKRVLFWLFGGAFLSGDAEGNVGIAENMTRQCDGMDAFLPSYRLMPEHDFDDMLGDVLLAYLYLLVDMKVRPEDVIVLGVSSGGGLATRLLQTLSEIGRSDLMPSGGVLMCPFVDYTEPRGSFKEYVAHDLIVNQSVYEVGVPYFEIKLGSDADRRLASPVHRSFRNLPPLCVVTSEHECVYDQTVDLVNRARSDGVDVTVGVWKYVCHVFPMLSAFVPEGRQATDFMCDWIREH